MSSSLVDEFEWFKVKGIDIHTKRDYVTVAAVYPEEFTVVMNEYAFCSICQALAWFSRRDLGEGYKGPFVYEWGSEV